MRPEKPCRYVVRSGSLYFGGPGEWVAFARDALHFRSLESALEQALEMRRDLGGEFTVEAYRPRSRPAGEGRHT